MVQLELIYRAVVETWPDTYDGGATAYKHENTQELRVMTMKSGNIPLVQCYPEKYST